MYDDDDSQADQVYLAEDLCLQETRGRHFASLVEIERWLTDVIRRPWFQQRFPLVESVVLHDGRGQTRGSGWRDQDGVGHMALPRALRHELVIVHELAHATGLHSHDQDFCSAYLTLVRRVLGSNAWSDLKTNFVVCDVRHRRLPSPPAWEYDAVGAI